MKLTPNLPTLGIKYKLYWIITSVAYILGLVATFISLFLMNSAQPALLYLVSLMVIMMMRRMVIMMIILKTTYYILGLVATFIPLFLMNSAQPALLYLVFIPRRILTNMMLSIIMQMMILRMRMRVVLVMMLIMMSIFAQYAHVYEVHLSRFPSP